MSFTRPTLTQIITRIKTDFKNGLQLTAILRRSFEEVYAKAIGGTSHTDRSRATTMARAGSRRNPLAARGLVRAARRAVPGAERARSSCATAGADDLAGVGGCGDVRTRRRVRVALVSCGRNTSGRNCHIGIGRRNDSRGAGRWGRALAGIVF